VLKRYADERYTARNPSAAAKHPNNQHSAPRICLEVSRGGIRGCRIGALFVKSTDVKYESLLDETEQWVICTIR
jgi:hypothetical protein